MEITQTGAWPYLVFHFGMYIKILLSALTLYLLGKAFREFTE